uniref:prefoldin subunit 5 isoform X2 n=1 Tax=Ictidomys tridecemlineatus TaxID=43179 RepID=UPI000683536E|nr:prefoldin subunit 5 isoform X2 [Ictidomys tridecemlineatus]
MAQSINITELNLPQLEMLKNQLDQVFVFVFTGKELLVPLTSSMYVPGKLHDVEHVLIDVGTGYYVEKTAEDAKDFFKRKIDFLTKQMEKIQPALQEKHTMKQAVMEMMSQKIQQLTALGAAQATAKA